MTNAAKSNHVWCACSCCCVICNFNVHAVKSKVEHTENSVVWADAGRDFSFLAPGDTDPNNLCWHRPLLRPLPVGNVGLVMSVRATTWLNSCRQEIIHLQQINVLSHQCKIALGNLSCRDIMAVKSLNMSHYTFLQYAGYQKEFAAVWKVCKEHGLCLISLKMWLEI